MIDEILTELRKFGDFTTIQRVKSFVIFNLAVDKKEELLKSIEKEYSLIYSNLKFQRNEELSEMLKEKNWISDNYLDLYHRYENTSLVKDIFKWENDAYITNYNQIAERNTELKILVDSFHFENVNSLELQQKEEVFNKMNEEMDFSNLLRYNQNKDSAMYYSLTEQEKQYMYLRNYLLKKRNTRYIFCYNTGCNFDFENLFKHRFKWDWLKWSIIGFEISQHDFENNASDFVKQELYYNREIIKN